MLYSGHCYDIKKDKKVMDEDSEEIDGEVNNSKRFVKISKNQSLSNQWLTLLHEFLHESWPVGVKISKQNEEDIIIGLSNGIFSFLMDNNLLNIFRKSNG